MIRDIFISYSRWNLDKVKAIKEDIEKATGVDCWMDLNAIESGSSQFTQDIVDGINGCRVFLFMLSKESQVSEFALRELNLAVKKAKTDKQKHVVIVNLDGCEMTDEFYLIYGLSDLIMWKDKPQRDKLIRDLMRWLDINDRTFTLSATIPTKSKATKKIVILTTIIVFVTLLVSGIYWQMRPSASSLYQQGIALYNKDEDDKAFPILLKSAELGYDSAQYAIGEMYYLGHGTNENDSEAMKWYRLAAEQGHGLAQYEVAENIYKEVLYGGDGTLEEAIRLFEAAAAQGVAGAQFQLALLYNQGLDVERDSIKSFNFCQQAAMQGHAKAQLLLGDYFLTGNGTEKNVAQAIILYKASAEQGNDVAQNKIGDYYTGYYDGTINEEEALVWYTKSAKQGNVDALYNIGNIYEKNKEWAEAAEYYQKAADKGQADALYKLGFMYWYGGFALPKNAVKGMSLLKEAAEKNNPAAMCLIGEIYENGLEGYKKDRVAAIYWYEKAAALGFKKAADLLIQIENEEANQFSGL